MKLKWELNWILKAVVVSTLSIMSLAANASTHEDAVI
jgi:hypothetical protein